MNRLLIVPLLLSLAASCSEKSSEKKPEPPISKAADPTPEPTPEPKAEPATVTEAERSALKNCSDGLASMTTADSEMQIPLFVSECGTALGYAKLMEADAAVKEKFISSSGFFCSEELATTAPKEREKGSDEAYDTASMFKECGAAYYGLEEDQWEYLSVSWFFFQRTTAWILQTRKKLIAEASSDADKGLYKILDSRLQSFRPIVPSFHKPQAVGMITPEGAVIDGDAKPAKTE